MQLHSKYHEQNGLICCFRLIETVIRITCVRVSIFPPLYKPVLLHKHINGFNISFLKCKQFMQLTPKVARYETFLVYNEQEFKLMKTCC